MGVDISEETRHPEKLSLGELSNHCARETQRFFNKQPNDPRFCYELFRRAAIDQDERAWEILYKQYHALTHRWILHHPAFPASNGEPQDFQNEAFARLWQSITSDRFSRFPDLAAILQFLKLCVFSVIIDQVRKNRWQEISEDIRLADPPAADYEDNPERLIEEQMDRAALWEHVQTVTKDEREGIVVYENYVLDLKSREKFERHSDLFPSVDDVYRVKQNMMARFRRDDELARRFGLDD